MNECARVKREKREERVRERETEKRDVCREKSIEH